LPGPARAGRHEDRSGGGAEAVRDAAQHEQELNFIRALNQENLGKPDQVLRHSAKQSANKKHQDQKESNMEDHYIPAHQISKLSF